MEYIVNARNFLDTEWTKANTKGDYTKQRVIELLDKSLEAYEHTLMEQQVSEAGAALQRSFDRRD